MTGDRGLVAAELTAGERTRSFTLRLPRDASGGIPPDRAVVAGVSNGAFMAHRMALEASEKVAVFAAAAGVGRTRVTAWTVFEGGHTWPGAKPFPGAAETGPQEFDAAEEICRFAGPLLTSAVSRRL